MPDILTAKRAIKVTCAKKAFVVATAISGPALTYKTCLASLAIEEPYTLTIAKVSIPSSLAFLRAAKESAVSPDWLITITKVSLS